MSRRQTDPLNPVRVLILGLTLVLLVAWFYRDRAFEPLIGILATLEFALLWITSRYPRLAAISIVFALGVFVVGLFFVLQQENGQPSNTQTPTSSAVGSFATASPEPTVAPPLPTVTSIPPTTNTPTFEPSPVRPTPTPTTLAITAPILKINDNRKLASLLPSQDDIPLNMKRFSANAITAREMATGSEFPADFYVLLAGWGSQGGYSVVYDAMDVCSTSSRYQVVSMTIYLFDDIAGAISLLEWMYDDMQNKAQNYPGSYWNFQDSTIGNDGYQYLADVFLCLGVESSQYHRIVFRRHNIIAVIDVTGFDSNAEEYSLDYWTVNLANIVDINIVAETLEQ